MSREVSSISRFGRDEPFDLQISRGQVAYHSSLFKYGYNPLIINVNETIWDGGGLYPYIGTAAPLAIASSTTTADAGVTGTVFGLDADYNEIQYDFTLGAGGTATTTNSFKRVFRAFITGSTAPTGNITFKIGATSYAQITAGENQTLMAVYTVPAGKTFYLAQGTATHGTDTSGAFMTVRFMIRSFGGVLRTATKVDIIGSELIFPFKYPLKLEEKTDIEVRAICSKNQNNSIAATFEGILIDNR